jgi:hypothetical protein
MKYYFSILISISFLTTLNAQTAIDKLTVDGSSALLDFATGTSKGIILPAVTTLPATPANGTFLYDKNDSKVKMYENSIWVNLSTQGGNSSDILAYNGTAANTKSIMGDQSTTADGVLVLESTNKAMILPKVALPHLNVPNPYPGMMCYDTTSKSLAVFDGTSWTYWK